MARPVYLDDPSLGGPLLATLHPAAGAADAAAPATGVLLCAPFGYDAMCAHRGLRTWAGELAADGRPALRFDLPGTGDSAGGPRDPEQARAWTTAVGVAARHLRAATGCRRVVAVGLGLGGLLAAQAAADGAPIDDLVLWGTPARGRALVRELRAFSRLGISDLDAFDFDAAGAPPLPDGAIESGGFLMSGETAAAVGAVDLTALDLTRIGRALLLGRDGVSVDARLVTALEAAGVAVTVEDGPGWSELTDEPHQAVAPAATIAVVARWLEEGEREAHAGPGNDVAAPATSDTLTLPGGGTETPVVLGDGPSAPVAIITTPGSDPFRCTGARVQRNGSDPGGLCVVLLNVGGERRVGPNRMWVEAARRWAARGVVTVRLDLPGIGDAGGPPSPWGAFLSLYCDELVDATGAALDALAARGLGPRFALVGLCSSGYWGFQQALRDDRVSALMLINPRMLLYDDTLGQAAEARHVRRVVSLDVWRQILRGRLTVARVRRLAAALLVMVRRVPAMLAARLRARRAGGDALDLAFDRLRDQDTTLGLWFTPDEPVLADLERTGHLDRLDRWPTMTVGHVPGPPDTHTLQVVRMQPLAHDVLDAWLDRQRARHAEPAAPSAAEIA